MHYWPQLWLLVKHSHHYCDHSVVDADDDGDDDGVNGNDLSFVFEAAVWMDPNQWMIHGWL